MSDWSIDRLSTVSSFALKTWQGLFLALAVLICGPLAAHADNTKIEGPNACSECHKDEAAAWQESHHFKTFREMPRRKEGRAIAKKMGFRRVKGADLCMSCHFTVQQASQNKKPKAIAGISCESCHGGGKEWIKRHSEFSGKTEETETREEEAARWQFADSKGMIRPATIYRLAKNCYSCHVVPQEDLVNVGGHPAGSDFELVSWSQGEVRHNSWYSKGNNEEASPGRKRILFLVGQGVELERALRAIGEANRRKKYAFAMAERADKARKILAKAANAAPNIPELSKMVQYGHSAGLKLKNAGALNAAADAVAKEILSLISKHDGTQLAAIDPLIPPPSAYKGQARQ